MTVTDVERVETDGLALVSQAEDIEITDASTFQNAGLFARAIQGYIKRVGEVMDPIVAATNEAHKVAVAQRNRLLEPAETAKRMVGAAMSGWEQAERNRVAEEQRKQEQERKRLEDEARMKEAERLEKEGKSAEAEKALTAPVQTPVFVAPVRQAETKVEGVGFRSTWSAEVTSLIDLVKAVAEGKAEVALLQPNMTALNGLARSLKNDLKIPGVKAKESRSTAVKA